MKLGVNIDHIATLRQARGGREPDPARGASICERAGAHSIVMHLREDRRHIQDGDLWEVRNAVSLKVNLEMSIAPKVVSVALRFKPDQVTLVPEKRAERTTEGGLDLSKKNAEIRRAVDEFRKKKISTSLFIDPDLKQVDEARSAGANAVEFHTGDYANERGRNGRDRELGRLERAVLHAHGQGLVTHAGHGLDYENVHALKRIQGIEELNIGYSIVCRALWTGLDAAVREMLRLVR